MERYMITSSIKVDDKYYWTRDSYKGATGLAKTINTKEVRAVVSVLDIAAGQLVNLEGNW